MTALRFIIDNASWPKMVHLGKDNGKYKYFLKSLKNDILYARHGQVS